MPKYISVDVLIEKYGDWYVEDSTGKSFIGNMRAFVYDVVPTADVVEVVRCKDCEYGKPKGECFYCTYEGHIHTDEFYCAHGEKKVYKSWELKE